MRRISLRLTAGMPFPKRIWSQYVGKNGLTWNEDEGRGAGILTLAPYWEPGALDEVWSPSDYVEDISAIGRLLAAGDLRTLYLLWLCAASDSDSSPADIAEPPVPSGLTAIASAAEALLEFYGFDPLILVAAAAVAPDSAPDQDRKREITFWVDGLDEQSSKQLLAKLLTEESIEAKNQILNEIRNSGSPSNWPCVDARRTLQELLDQTQVLRNQHDTAMRGQREAAVRRQSEEQERERQIRMTQMVKNPTEWLHNVDKCVEARGTNNYEAAADILADLREALDDAGGEELARCHAAYLADKHPTLNRLKSSLRKRGLLE